MKKLRLDVEGLLVESFVATPRREAEMRGTVQGHDASARICPQYPDPSNDTGTIETGPFLCSSSSIIY